MMKAYTADSIRNIALIGHGGSGKTTIASCLLFDTNMVNRLGSVDSGTTITDFNEDEIERKISINAATCYVEYKKLKINILDTPGYGNFISEAKLALAAVDMAYIIINAAAGVEVQTDKVWKFCQEFQLPRIFIINKMDRDNADFDKSLQSLQKSYGRSVVPIHLPIGKETDFKGIIDTINMKAYLYKDDQSGNFSTVDIPAELKEHTIKMRKSLIEAVAEMDEELMEAYLETEDLPQDKFLQGLKKAIHSLNIYPVLVSSALKNMGMQLILDSIAQFAPSPTELKPKKGINPDTNKEEERQPLDSDPFSAFVFKTISDPYMGKITFFRIYSGSLSPDKQIFNATRNTPEKIGAIYVMQGKNSTTIPEAHSGDIVADVKLKDTRTNDTLCATDAKILYPQVQLQKPIVSFAIEPKSRADEEKITTALQKISEEDPVLHFERDPQTKELLISGAGQLHIEVVIGRLKNRFGVDVILHPPKIPYKETIKGTSEVQGKYKKQSGGRGQYGDCWIKFEPLPRGSDFQFEDKIFGGAIPKNYIPSVEKGIQEARQKGVLAGYPTVDFKATLFDGSYHTVDSSDLAFKIAASMAFKKGIQQAKPILLEPIMNVEIYAPDECTGDVLGDLNSRRGRVLGMNSSAGTTIINAQVPLAELINYAPALTSITGGRGYYEMAFSHYDEVPTHISQKIIQEAQARLKEEEEQE